MKNVYSNITQLVGNTPIVELKKAVPSGPHRFFAKLEYMNPGGSVKDRVGLSIIEEAEKRGDLKPGGTIVEATSGNTGMGLAMVAAVKGYKCIFVMTDKVSKEKQDILSAYGAKLVITRGDVAPEHPESYVNVSKKIASDTPNSFLANQFNNPDNPKIHYKMTGPELWEQMDHKVDVFVGGAGTGGTISGVGRFLKEKNKNIKVILADPVGSILFDLYYHKKIITPAAPYKVEGVGEDWLPDNIHFDVMDGVEQVEDKAAFRLTKDLVSKEGICVGPSAGMALVAAIQYSKKITQPSNILVLFPDGGKAYLSKAFNDQWLKDNNLI